MKGKLSLTTPAHILAASPMIWKELVEKLKIQCIETNTYEEADDIGSKHTPILSPVATQLMIGHKPVYSLSLLVSPLLDGNPTRTNVESRSVRLGMGVAILLRQTA